MSKLYTEKSQCTGCHSCLNICQAQAITMKSDDQGFLYPVIDRDKCVDCGLCESVCPISKSIPDSQNIPEAYAAVCSRDEIRLGSSSGGVFPLLAEYILKKEGVVFGAVNREDCKGVEHQAAFNIEENMAQRGSKYVQSRIGNTYQEAKRLLESGKPVLFTGTPCQISGLYAYLGKDYGNLYTQDLICHGAPSPLVWEKYVAGIEKKMGEPVRKVSFRNKENGWRNYSLRMEFSGQPAYTKNLREDLYLKGFLYNLFLRPSCYDCRYKALARQSDLTLADFWHIEKVLPEIDDDRGASLIFVHTQKGRELLRAVQNDLLMIPVDARVGVKYNPSAIQSSRCPDRREEFMKDLKRYSFDKLSRKYIAPSGFAKWRRKVKKKIKACFGKEEKTKLG